MPETQQETENRVKLAIVIAILSTVACVIMVPGIFRMLDWVNEIERVATNNASDIRQIKNSLASSMSKVDMIPIIAQELKEIRDRTVFDTAMRQKQWDKYMQVGDELRSLSRDVAHITQTQRKLVDSLDGVTPKMVRNEMMDQFQKLREDLKKGR